MSSALAALPPGLADWQYGALWLLVGSVLVLPFVIRWVEHNLEAFLLLMGAVAVTISGAWALGLVGEALRQPVGITLAVLAAGLAFHYGRGWLDRRFRALQARLPLKVLIFLVVAGLGVLSSVVTCIIAALVLVEIIHLLRLDRRREEELTILACFAIGLGAVLTPVGEPLSTIVTARLHGGFWLLFGMLGGWVLPGVIGLGLVAAWVHPPRGRGSLKDVRRGETLPDVVIRAAKVYLFVAALILLGAGLAPLVERFIVRLPAALLFWVNMISAILDNATLAAAEIGPVMSHDQMMAVLLGLLISGGMLIPGNIPNIIAASHLKIGSRAWARFGVPVGLGLMVAYFAAWMTLHG